MTDGEPGDVDLGCQAAVTDPAGYFAGRRGSAGVRWSEAQRGWAVVSHAAAVEAFRDTRRFSADRVSTLERLVARDPERLRPVLELLSNWMIFRDDPAHAALREPVRHEFTPRRALAVEDVVRGLVREAFDALGRRPEHADWMGAVAGPVPARTIAALLGVPDDDLADLSRWSDDLAAVVFTTRPGATPTVAGATAARELHDRFDRYLTEGDVADDGLVARLTAAGGEGALDGTQMAALGVMLLFAGHETTTSLLNSTPAVLVEHPGTFERLRRGDLATEPLVEELLRVAGPARTMVRLVRQAGEWRGVELREGERVFVSIAAANHDPAVFDDPATFSPDRDPNPHLAFGWGAHHCLGAALARLEVRLVLEEMVRRFEALRVAGPVPPVMGSVLGQVRPPVALDLSGPRTPS